jgi:hypothetical protein
VTPKVFEGLSVSYVRLGTPRAREHRMVQNLD